MAMPNQFAIAPNPNISNLARMLAEASEAGPQPASEDAASEP
jgi:hypothetical protein